MTTFNKKEFFNWGRWPQPVISGSYWNDWWHLSNNLKKYFPIPHSAILLLDGHALMSNKSFPVVEEFISKYETDFDVLDAIKKDVLDLISRIKKSINIKGSTLQKAQTFDKLFKQIIAPWVLFGAYVSPLVDKKLTELSKTSKLSFSELVETVHPFTPTELQLQIQEAQELYDTIKEQKIPIQKVETSTLAKEIQEHIIKFQYMGLHHFVGEPYNLHKFKKNYGEQEQPKEKTVKDLTNVEKWTVELGNIAAYARTAMAEFSGYMQWHMQETFAVIQKELNISKEFFLQLSFHEIIRGLEDPEKFTLPENFGERKKAYGSIWNDNAPLILTGKELEELKDELIEKADTDTTSVKGMIACKGKVEGKVRVVLSQKDADMFEKDEIMVVQETTPNFVPIMKKSKGIIANGGGITSHAAIISRELNKPCLIATKIATEVFKTGDNVELDADKGVARKII